jgi:hypothetical protein
MAEEIVCPDCHAKLILPEAVLGKSVQCPRCSARFTAALPGPRPATVLPAADPAGATPASAPPPLPGARGGYAAPRVADGPSEEDREEREEVATDHRSPDDSAARRGVRAGVGLHLLGHILYLAGLALALFVAFIAAVEPGSSGGSGRSREIILLILISFGLVALLANWALATVGSCVWVTAPVSSVARGLGVAAAVFGGLVLLRLPDFLRLLVFSPFLGPADRGLVFFPGSEQPVVLADIVLEMTFLEMARLIVFPFYLRAAALELRAPTVSGNGLALGVGTLAVFGLTILVCLFVGLVDAGRTRPLPLGDPNLRPGATGRIFAFLFLGAWLVVVVWGTVVLGVARGALGGRLRRY